MKCRNCGAEIGLLDEVCPHCGSVNTESAGHLAGMKNYQKLSKKTKGTVRESIGQNVPLVVSAIVLVFLIVGIGIASHVAENAFMFQSDAARKESLKKYEEYSEKMLQFLEAGDYTGFAAFKELHEIPIYEAEYKEFEILWDFAHEYVKVLNSVEEAVFFGPDSKRYLMEEYVFSCRLFIAPFYDEYDRVMRDLGDYKYREFIVGMKKQADTALKIYLGLDEEKLKEYLESSSNRQEAYLEEVLIGE